MPKPGYSFQKSEKTARAFMREKNVSIKFCEEIAKEIKGRKLESARKILEQVIEKKRAIPYRSHHKEVSHKKGKGFKPGGFPVKASKTMLELIRMAEENALNKGLEGELRIKAIVISKGRRFFKPIYRHPGSREIIRRKSANLEIVVG